MEPVLDYVLYLVLGWFAFFVLWRIGWIPSAGTEPRGHHGQQPHHGGGGGGKKHKHRNRNGGGGQPVQQPPIPPPQRTGHSPSAAQPVHRAGNGQPQRVRRDWTP